MTTTSAFQNKPDFYSSKEECLNDRDKQQTNPRYKNFRQTHFTAGDEEQFSQYRDITNGDICISNISLDKNIFTKQTFSPWNKHKDLQADAVINTFRYIFHKFKKGIFVKIMNNKLRVFLPFSKANFVNEWGDKIKINKDKYGTVKDFIRHISQMEGRNFNPRYVNDNYNEWYGNNCLVRYELPISEGESNVGNVKNMLEELCAQRKVPDIEFFINRRDFPIITRDDTEPYNNIWGSTEQPLISHLYDKYVPILSMSNTVKYADILIPTWEDWARIQSYENKWFPRACRDYTEKFNVPWDNKKPTAVFRGGTTGCGVTIDSNPRLKLAYLSSVTELDENGVPYLDAGVTNWNLRPRKLQNEKYLRTIEIEDLPFGLSNRLSPQEQAGYKYIINVDGHVTAFRLSMELSMGSVILLVDSPWKIWYRDMLVPYEHYVPVREDLSNLIEQIKWCRENDLKCQGIAQNALQFFNTYLHKKGVLDYMQKTLIDIKSEMGIYLYNTVTPLDTLIQMEYNQLDFSHPEINKGLDKINVIPMMGRSYGLLQGIEWVVRKIISDDGDFEKFSEEKEEIFQNNLEKIRAFRIADFSVVVKNTFDSQKVREYIHETYIGTKSINELCKYIPNFAYVFGMYRKGDTFNVITERIYGNTLFEYINSTSFNFQEFLFILIQICLAIQVAQNRCGLVHYDLTPWNIILQRLGTPVEFDYILSHNNIVRIRTSIIPIIINYGKSHVIHKEEHHGLIRMFNVCTIQDIVTILVKSIDQIINKQHLPQKDYQNLLHLANFLSGTTYRKDTFKNARDLREFFSKLRNYSALLYDDKYELKKLIPYDLVKYIMKKTRKDYKFLIGVVKEYHPSMDKGNSRQVFEYIFSNSIEERIKTYENVFIRLKHCTLPQPNNLFFIYYAVQQLENNLVSTWNNMLYFLKYMKIESSKYERIFKETMLFLNKFYENKIDTFEEDNVSYDISEDFTTLIPAPYNEETFLLPDIILNMLSSKQITDLSDYKDIIEMILLNHGKYQLRDKDREYYLQNFKALLDTNSLIMKNNSANVNTLNILASNIYKSDFEFLQSQLLSKNYENCHNALNYFKLYEKLLNNMSIYDND